MASLIDKKYLVVGGTDGIGACAAKSLAEKGKEMHSNLRFPHIQLTIKAIQTTISYLIGAKVLITGRSEEKAKGIVNDSITFHKVDIHELRELDLFCKNLSNGKIFDATEGLDGVLLCAGG